jgi:hypothetical protein
VAVSEVCAMIDAERAELETLRTRIKEIAEGRKAKSSYAFLVKVAHEAGYKNGKNESNEQMLVRIITGDFK